MWVTQKHQDQVQYEQLHAATEAMRSLLINSKAAHGTILEDLE